MKDYDNIENVGPASDGKKQSDLQNEDRDKKTKESSDHIAAILPGAVAESSSSDHCAHKDKLLSLTPPTTIPTAAHDGQEDDVVVDLTSPSMIPGAVALVSDSFESKKSKGEDGALSLLGPSVSLSTSATTTTTTTTKDPPATFDTTSTTNTSTLSTNVVPKETVSNVASDPSESQSVWKNDFSNDVPVETVAPNVVAQPALDDDDVAAQVAQQLEEQIDSQWKERFEQEVQAQLDAQLQKESPVVTVVTNQPKESFSFPTSDDNTINCDVKPKTLLVIAFLVLLVIGGVVGAVVAVASSSNSEKDTSDDSTMVPTDTITTRGPDATTETPTFSPTEPDTLSRRDFWVELIRNDQHLANTSSSYLELFDDPETPQARAVLWLSQEDEYTLYPHQLDTQELVERYAFMVLYYSTTSGLDWLIDESTSICRWNVEIQGYYHGIYCVDSNHFGLLSHIFLSGWEIVGTIPWEITWFNHMTYWLMDTNALSGSLPSGLDRLTSLQHILLYSNSLTGTIPSELPESLTYLVLFNNTLTGTLPSDWPDEIPNLAVMLLDQNQLEGSIPTGWRKGFPSLEALTLSNNTLTGSIPTELGEVSNLWFLGLGANQLTGTVPSELGNLSMMAQLSFHDNLLTGTIPQAFGQLEYLITFWFYWNYLTGSVDSIFCNGVFEEDALEIRADCLGGELNPSVVECSCCDVCCSLEEAICQ